MNYQASGAAAEIAYREPTISPHALPLLPEGVAFDVDGCTGQYSSPVASDATRFVWPIYREKNPGSVGFASGKNLDYLVGYSGSNGLKTDFIIAENGGQILLDGEVIKYRNGGSVVDFKDRFYSDSRHGYIKAPFFEENGKHAVFTVFSCALDPFRQKEDVNYLTEYCNELAQRMGLNLTVIPHKDCVDIQPSGLSKGYAIDEVARMLGVNPSMILRIGDGLNDIEMLGNGIAAAPGNAKEEVKRIVNERGGYIAKKQYGEGLVEIYEHHWGPLDI